MACVFQILAVAHGSKSLFLKNLTAFVEVSVTLLKQIIKARFFSTFKSSLQKLWSLIKIFCDYSDSNFPFLNSNSCITLK